MRSQLRTQQLTKPLTGKPSTPAIGERAAIVGKNIVYNGSTLWVGTNQGNWGENYQPDAAIIKSYGANVVRILIRWQGDDYDPGTDCYSATNLATCLPTNWNQFQNELDWLEAQGLWIVFAVDSNNGAAVRGLGTADWNFFDTLDTANQAKYTEEYYRFWEFLVRTNMHRNRILCWELLPEPMQTGSNASHGVTLKAWYLALMNRIRKIDPVTPFLIGGRASYGINTMPEVYFSDRTDVIYTADFLTNKVEDEDTIAASLETITSFRDTNNVPVLIQQFGRNTSDDEGAGTTSENAGLTALNGGLFMLRAQNIPFTHWQFHQNSVNPGAYALWYKTNANVDSADNWTPKLNEIAAFTYHMNVTGAALEAAAIAAATACGGELIYIKSDLSNVFQNSAGTTPVTAVGQPIGRVNAVVGSRNFQQTTDALRPTLAAAINGYQVSFLPAAESWLACDTTYFTTADTTQTVICAARPPVSASNRFLVHCGTSAATVRWPGLLVSATDEMQAAWRGDDNVLQASSTVTLCDNRAIVATASMTSTTDKRAFLDGAQEGTTNTVAAGTIASLTRLRWGASTSATNGLFGPSALIFICRSAVTAEQRRAIERWAAWLIGCPFRGAIPA